MATKVSASDNPDLANKLLADAMAGKPPSNPATVQMVPPADTLVELPGGYLAPTGEIVTRAEVRELTGRDEEALARLSGGRQLLAALARGVVSVGAEQATDALLDGLLIGDRDYLLLQVYRATFGDDIEYQGVHCPTCGAQAVVHLRVGDIPVKRQSDPGARRFTVQGRTHVYTVLLPTGHAQRAVLNNPDGTAAEWATEVLFNAVLEIDGTAVYSKEQIKSLGVADRRTLAKEITERAVGPELTSCSATCTTCGGSVAVGVNLGDLFRF